MHPAAGIVEQYLRVLMIPDPAAARAYLGAEFETRFTGNRPMRDPAECAAFNARRYKWVKKRFGPTHVAEGGTEDETVVYQTGTLYGEWPDGAPFEGNRYVDRYVVRRGKIVRMEVWNDSAEWLLVRAGLAKPCPGAARAEIVRTLCLLGHCAACRLQRARRPAVCRLHRLKP